MPDFLGRGRIEWDPEPGLIYASRRHLLATKALELSVRNGGKDTEYALGQKQRKLPLYDPTSCLSLVSCTPYLSPPTKTKTGRLKADCRSGEGQNQHSLCSYSRLKWTHRVSLHDKSFKGLVRVVSVKSYSTCSLQHPLTWPSLLYGYWISVQNKSIRKQQDIIQIYTMVTYRHFV